MPYQVDPFLQARLNWPQCTTREFPDFPKLEMSGGCETFAASGDLCRVSPRGYVSARDNCSLDPCLSCLPVLLVERREIDRARFHYFQRFKIFDRKKKELASPPCREYNFSR